MNKRNSELINKYAPPVVILLALAVVLVVAMTGLSDNKPAPPDRSSSEPSAGIPENTIPDAAEDTGTSPESEPVDSTDTDLAANEAVPEPSLAGTADEDEEENEITPTEDITMAPINIDEAFYISDITDDIFARIKGKSYPDDCTLSLDEIRYVHVMHYDFEGNITEGEIIVNTAIAEDVLEIFRELFDIEYPIEKMTLIDAYDADDERSMEDNNTSAFNYRFIAETTVLSNHALGRAIDINPLYNPYVYVRKDGSTFLQPYNAGDYVDREKDNPYYIRRNDACYNIFISHGFTWGGDWNSKKDYQHFEKAE